MVAECLATADEYYYKHQNNEISVERNRAEMDLDEDEYFPLQPIEKKLCAYSFGLGIVLMAAFILAFEVI